MYVSGSHDKSLESHWLIIMGRESNFTSIDKNCDFEYIVVTENWKNYENLHQFLHHKQISVLGWAFVHDFWVYYTLVVLLDIGKKRYSVLWSPLSLRNYTSQSNFMKA